MRIINISVYRDGGTTLIETEFNQEFNDGGAKWTVTFKPNKNAG